jgi:hypothetical protein
LAGSDTKSQFNLENKRYDILPAIETKFVLVMAKNSILTVSRGPEINGGQYLQSVSIWLKLPAEWDTGLEDGHGIRNSANPENGGAILQIR